MTLKVAETVALAIMALAGIPVSRFLTPSEINRPGETDSGHGTVTRLVGAVICLALMLGIVAACHHFFG